MQGRRNVRFEERGVHHPTREKTARPSKEWMLPMGARAQYIGRFHTGADKRASEQKLLADSAAIKEFVEVKRMCNHQKKVVVARRKIKCPTHSALPVAATTRLSAVADTGYSASGIISPTDHIAHR